MTARGRTACGWPCWSRCEPGHVPDYRLEVTYEGADPVTVDDPYRYLPTVGEVDLHLIGEGRHEKLWEVLGAHVQHYKSSLGDVDGVSFAVWAPNAQAVRVKGDFNGWDGRENSLRSLGSSGVWELFLPGRFSRGVLQIRNQDQGRLLGGKSGPAGLRNRGPAADGIPGGGAVLRLQGRRVDGGPRRAGSAQLAHERLRGPPRLLAPGPGLPRTGQGTGGVRQVARLHPRGVHAGGRAPLRRLLGLPGHVLLRARPRGSATRTSSATWWTPCTRPASACCWTGSRRTSPRTPGRWPSSTASRCTSTPTRTWASTRTGER